MRKSQAWSQQHGKIRVLHVTETLRGGLNTYLEEVINHQVGDAAFEEVALVAPVLDLLHSTVSPSRAFPFERTGRNIGSLIRFSIALFVALIESKPNIVHLHSSFAGLIGRILLLPWFLNGRVRIVYTAHGWSYLALTRSWQKAAGMKAEKLLASLSSKIVAVSESEMALAIESGVRKEKTCVIHNPRTPLVDDGVTSSANEHRRSGLQLLFVGRLDHAKGFDMLLEALKLVRRNDWALDVVGESIHDSQPVIPESIRSRVRLRGWLSGPQLAHAYRSASCVLIPSRWEAFGLVAIEAMQLERAVYASRVGGLIEIVKDGVTGRLVEPTASEWASAIDGISIDNLHLLGVEGGRRAMSYFSAEASNNKLAALYEELVGLKVR